MDWIVQERVPTGPPRDPTIPDIPVVGVLGCAKKSETICIHQHCNLFRECGLKDLLLEIKVRLLKAGL